MQELELTWTRIIKVGWLITWRGILGGALFGFVVGFVVGFVGAIIGIDDQQRNLAILAIVVVFTPIWWLVVLRMALRKRYGDFRLAIVR